MVASGDPSKNVHEKKQFWSIVVPPGRHKCVDPGKGNTVKITNISFVHFGSAEFVPPLDNDHMFVGGERRAARCEVYLGINKTKAEFVIGYLNSRQPQLSSMNLQLNEIFSLAHSAYSSLCFTGYKTGSDEPKPTPKDLTAEKDSNLVNWPLSVDLTAKIMSMLGCSAQVARVELVSKIFYTAGLTSGAYRNVDLSNFPPAEDLTVLTCIQRSYGQPSSLTIGCERGPNRQYTSRSLQSDYGRSIRKMCLLDIDITENDLVSPFSQCNQLTELCIRGEISIDFVFRAMASHCPLLEVLDYSTKADPWTYGAAIHDDALRTFVEKCPRVKGLGLRSVMASDSQILVIIEGFKTLTRLNLSRSRGFTGSFLCGIQNGGLELQKLRLLACETLSEESLGAFVSELCDRDYFPNLKLLVVKGEFGSTILKEGFEARIAALDDLKESRQMTIDMGSELESELYGEALADYESGSESGSNGQQEVQQEGFVDGNMTDVLQEVLAGIEQDMMNEPQEVFDGPEEGFDGVALHGEMMDGQEGGEEDYWLDRDEWYHDWRTYEDRKRKKYFHWCMKEEKEKKNGEPL